MFLVLQVYCLSIVCEFRDGIFVFVLFFGSHPRLSTLFNRGGALCFVFWFSSEVLYDIMPLKKITIFGP